MFSMPTPKPEFTPLSWEASQALSKTDYPAYSQYHRDRQAFRNWEAHDLACRVQRLRAGLNIAFKAMRKQGLMARQNFSCCFSCAGYAMATDAFALHQKGKTIAGYVTYTRQDAETIEKSGEIELSYGQIEHSGYADGKPVDFNEKDDTKIVRTTIGKPAEEVGKMIVAAMQAAGLQIEWDGEPTSFIRVFTTADAVIVGTPEPTPTKSAPVPTLTKPVCQLIGTDGNVFSLAGRVSGVLRKAGLTTQITKFQDRLQKCGSYDAALVLMGEYVEIR